MLLMSTGTVLDNDKTLVGWGVCLTFFPFLIEAFVLPSLRNHQFSLSLCENRVFLCDSRLFLAC